MIMCKYVFWLLMVALMSVSDVSVGQSDTGQVAREDLSDCKLRHGITVLPKKGSRKSIEMNGYIFDFEKNQLGIDPFEREDKRPKTFKEFRDSVIADQTGDVYFESIGEQLGLIAFSGRIKEMGEHFLHEFSGLQLAEPELVYHVEEGEKLEGILAKISPGHCYLMTTVDGELVLLRVISVDGDRRACTIQWVMQAPSSEAFEIPKGRILEWQVGQSSARNAGEAAVGEAKAPVMPKMRFDRIEYVKGVEEFRRAIETHLENRQSVTRKLMEVLQGEDGKGMEGYIAVEALGTMRAGEAAGLLASIIDAPLAYGASWSVTMDGWFPCAAALVKIGKPGASACLEEIVRLTLEEKERPFKQKLLCSVIVRVEGEKVARILLEDEKARVTDPQQTENLERALGFIDEVKSWDEAVAWSQPAIDRVNVPPRGEQVGLPVAVPSVQRPWAAMGYLLIGMAVGLAIGGLALLLKKKGSISTKTK